MGPLTEADSITKAVEYLRGVGPASYYERAAAQRYPNSRRQCDLVIPGHWAIEFKLIRPYGDNGNEAEHWSENILHPYEGNHSSIGDCIKLLRSGFPERKAVIVFGYEHTPPLIDLEPAVTSFEVIATQVIKIQLSERRVAEFRDLIHPVHRQGRVFGWEVIGFAHQE